MRDESSRYAYVTIGVVAVVALLAAWLIIGHAPISQGSDANLRGRASESIYPLIYSPTVGTDIPVGSATVSLYEVSATRASVGIQATPSGPLRPVTLPLGGSIPIGDFTLTLMAGDPAGRTAELHVSANALACGARDAQERLCAGASACCGGACVELPDCAGTADGPVSPCGERPLYCCSGALGFDPCGGKQ